jgi:hypothetical protein
VEDGVEEGEDEDEVGVGLLSPLLLGSVPSIIWLEINYFKVVSFK